MNIDSFWFLLSAEGEKVVKTQKKSLLLQRNEKIR